MIRELEEFRRDDIARLRFKVSMGPQAEKVMEFAKALEVEFHGKVVLWDERLSTRAATRVLIEGGVRRKKRKRLTDGVAALVLLQSYLDSLKEKEE